VDVYREAIKNGDTSHKWVSGNFYTITRLDVL